MNTRFPFRASSDVQGELSSEDAYDRLLPTIESVRAEELVKINLDVPTVVATVLGVVPQILALRESAAGLAGFGIDVTHFDMLEDCALALGHAHATSVSIKRRSDDLAELLAEAQQTRTRLYLDARSLCEHGLIDRGALSGYKGIVGYKVVAADVLMLVTLFGTHWDAVQGRCPVTTGDLERAEKLAIRMLRLVGLRDKTSASRKRAADLRARAFALLVRCYDSVRRAVTFLRWREGDVDQIAPSLWAARKPRKRKRDTAGDTADSPATSATATQEPTEGAPTYGPPPVSGEDESPQVTTANHQPTAGTPKGAGIATPPPTLGEDKRIQSPAMEGGGSQRTTAPAALNPGDPRAGPYLD